MKKLCLWIMVVCLVLTTLSASAFAYTELDYSCFEGEWFWSIADNDNVDTRRELASADLRIIQCNGEYLTFEFYGTAYHYLRKVYGTRIGIYDNTAYAENEDGLYVRLYFSESGISFETNMKSGASAALAKSDGFYPRTNEVDYARDINMCVGGYNLRRTIASVNGFDMLPILDVACELGFNVIFNDNEYILTNNIVSYTFKNGEAAVANTTGEWIGLDIVPQYIKGRFMIPAKFFTDVFGYSYVWDSVTDTVFINSTEQYNALINSADRQTTSDLSKYLGEWYTYYEDTPYAKLTISEINDTYLVACMEKLRGKAVYWEIGKATFTDSATAVSEGRYKVPAYDTDISQKYIIRLADDNIYLIADDDLAEEIILERER